MLDPIHATTPLKKRKFYCEKELILNQRLTKDMYLAVVPIRKDGGSIAMEGTSGEVIDYAVKMRRMDESRQMNILLENGQVTNEHIAQIADQLAGFHKNAERIKGMPDIDAMKADFADILKVKNFIGQNIGSMGTKVLEEAVVFSEQFLNKHATRLQERHEKGFTIDGHGDLHSKNILLLDQPVIFDCIEFSDHFRQVDVLNELAFFCMDLDFYGQTDLATVFLKNYFSKHPCLFDEADHHIFKYYKLYRANVRAKVNALKAMQTTDTDELKKRLNLVKAYLDLMKRYIASFPVFQRSLSFS